AAARPHRAGWQPGGVRLRELCVRGASYLVGGAGDAVESRLARARSGAGKVEAASNSRFHSRAAVGVELASPAGIEGNENGRSLLRLYEVFCNCRCNRP